jgi:hypothetical protein
MQTTTALRRANVSDTVAAVVRAMIVEGALSSTPSLGYGVRLAGLPSPQSLARLRALNARIKAALWRKDLDAACAALRHNLQTGHDPILAWLKQRYS